MDGYGYSNKLRIYLHTSVDLARWETPEYKLVRMAVGHGLGNICKGRATWRVLPAERGNEISATAVVRHFVPNEFVYRRGRLPGAVESILYTEREDEGLMTLVGRVNADELALNMHKLIG